MTTQLSPSLQSQGAEGREQEPVSSELGGQIGDAADSACDEALGGPALGSGGPGQAASPPWTSVLFSGQRRAEATDSQGTLSSCKLGSHLDGIARCRDSAPVQGWAHRSPSGLSPVSVQKCHWHTPMSIRLYIVCTTSAAE